MRFDFTLILFFLGPTLLNAYFTIHLRHESQVARLERSRAAVALILGKFRRSWNSYVAGHKGISRSVQPYIDGKTDHVIIPNEVWTLIFSLIKDFKSYLAICQINKATNFLMRTEPLSDIMVDSQPHILSIAHLYHCTPMLLPHQVIPYINNILKTARDAKGKEAKSDFEELIKRLAERSKDLEFLQNLFHFSRDCNKLPLYDVEALKAVSENFYLVKGYCGGDRRKIGSWASMPPVVLPAKYSGPSVEQYVWLPPASEDRPLFHIFTERFVASVMGGYKITFRGMFAHCILADYIIPAYNLDFGMSERKLRPLRAFMDSNSYMNYFYYLFKAVSYLTPDFRSTGRDKTSHLRKINDFLKSIGFEIGRLHDCHPDSREWADPRYNIEADMWSVFRAAQHWNLPWKQIAVRTNLWCELSQQILKGEIPEGLDPLAPLTSLDVFKVSFPHETDPKKMSINPKNGAALETVGSKKRKLQHKQDNGRGNKKVKVPASPEEAPSSSLLKDSSDDLVHQLLDNFPTTGVVQPQPLLNHAFDHMAFMAPNQPFNMTFVLPNQPLMALNQPLMTRVQPLMTPNQPFTPFNQPPIYPNPFPIPFDPFNAPNHPLNMPEQPKFPQFTHFDANFSELDFMALPALNAGATPTFSEETDEAVLDEPESID